jgi:diguanylate cyclase (GGDEF)-like protein
MYLLGISAIIFALPVAILNLIDGEILLCVSTVLTFSILAVEAVAIRRKVTLRLMMPLFLTSLMLVIWISIHRRGVVGLFWAYPTVLFISFVVSHKMAKIYLLIFFVYISTLALYFINLKIAFRAIIGLMITITFTNIFLNVIYRLREQLLKQSISDPLTGALNRRELTFSLEGAIERRNRVGESASLLSIDIDDFKSINDKYGHDVGDKVIKEVVSITSLRSRKLDRLFRVGGEEFTLLLPMTGATGAMTVATQLGEMISTADLIKERKVTVSIGVCELGESITTDEWLKQVDLALYEAKNSGKNRAVCWHQMGKNKPVRVKTDNGLPKQKPVFVS